MSQFDGFREVDASHREEASGSKWGLLLTALLDGKTVFVPKAEAAAAKNSLRQSFRSEAVRNRGLRLRIRTKAIEGDDGVAMWAENTVEVGS